MRILFYGDSITDAGRDRGNDLSVVGLGGGYVRDVAAQLLDGSGKDTVINRGISGNRVVDLYARIKLDCWNLEPDVLSILIGVNDVWHEVDGGNGVDVDRFEKVYRMMIEDTKRRLPDVKMILCEPFFLRGSATEEKYEGFKQVYDYAKIVKKIAEEYGLYFLPLQDKFTAMEASGCGTNYLRDGVHPAIPGAKLIADEWVKLFREHINN